MVGDAVLTGSLDAADGVTGNEISIGECTFGTCSWPMETINLPDTRNLRINFGDTQRLLLGNTGILQLQTSGGGHMQLMGDGFAAVDVKNVSGQFQVETAGSVDFIAFSDGRVGADQYCDKSGNNCSAPAQSVTVPPDCNGTNLALGYDAAEGLWLCNDVEASVPQETIHVLTNVDVLNIAKKTTQPFPNKANGVALGDSTTPQLLCDTFAGSGTARVIDMKAVTLAGNWSGSQRVVGMWTGTEWVPQLLGNESSNPTGLKGYGTLTCGVTP